MRKNEYTELINAVKASETMKQKMKEKMLQQENMLQHEKLLQQNKNQKEKKLQHKTILVQEKSPKKDKRINRSFWFKHPVQIISVAIASFLIVLFSGKMILENQNLIPLENSHGSVKVKYIKNAPDIRSSYDLVYYTEEELVQRDGLEIVQGTITDIKNIEVTIEGNEEYYALASILVEKVYQGQSQVGDVIVIKLPCPIKNGVWVEDTEVASAMRVGMKGIFMPFTYDDENSFYQQGNTTLYWKDIVDYGLLDGERYAFLETSDGIKYAEFAYPSLEGTKSLEDIENFIVTMLESKE